MFLSSQYLAMDSEPVEHYAVLFMVWRRFHDRVVSALDYEAAVTSSISLDWKIGAVRTRTEGPFGNSLFHLYQVEIFVDYPC